MGLISDEDAIEIRERLQQMVEPVKLVHFHPGGEPGAWR